MLWLQGAQQDGGPSAHQAGGLAPDDKVRRYLVYLKYWTLSLNPLMVYPKVLFRPYFIINWACMNSLYLVKQPYHAQSCRQPRKSLQRRHDLHQSEAGR